MRNKIADFLREHHLERHYKPMRVGDETYHLILPFVHQHQDKIKKAIKPLHLDKEAPTEIYRHGDFWISSLKRLQRINRLPKEMLFTVKAPKANPERIAAAEEICKELQNFGAATVPFAETNRILEFVRI